jgi:hypothetical protein
MTLSIMASIITLHVQRSNATTAQLSPRRTAPESAKDYARDM